MRRILITLLLITTIIGGALSQKIYHNELPPLSGDYTIVYFDGYSPSEVEYMLELCIDFASTIDIEEDKDLCVTPNPFFGPHTVKYMYDADVLGEFDSTITVYNHWGEVIYFDYITTKSGRNDLQLDAARFRRSTGIVYYMITVNGKIITGDAIRI